MSGRSPLGERVQTVRRSAHLERARARAPRFLFLAVILLLVALGLRELVAPAEPAPARTSVRAVDHAAEDFAQRFARAYLAWDSFAPAARERALRSLVPDDLEGDAGLTPAGGSQEVLWTQVAQNQEAIAGGRVIVVAAGVSTQEAPLYLAVPVYRAEDDAIGLAGYPSLVGPPTVAGGELGDREEVEDEAILAVANRVVGNYLAGERANLAADLAPEASVSLPTRALRVLSVADVAWARGEGSSAVLVTATARDQDRAVWTLTYEVGIDMRRGRPYVTFVETVPNAT